MKVLSNIIFYWEMISIINSDNIKKNLSTKFLGKNIILFDSIDSTNNYCKSNHSILTNGSIILANEQTAGRGQLNKTFYSPPNQGIYMSVLLKPYVYTQNISLLTICACIAVSMAIDNIANITTQIKWVNDIFYNKKKLCGILTETVLPSTSIPDENNSCIVIGIGINTGQLATEIENIASSIKDKITPESKDIIIAEILNNFEEIYLDFNNQNINYIIEEYNKKLFIKNHLISILKNNQITTGIAIGINNKGYLLINSEDKIIEFSSGQITI